MSLFFMLLFFGIIIVCGISLSKDASYSKPDVRQLEKDNKALQAENDELIDYIKALETVAGWQLNPAEQEQLMDNVRREFEKEQNAKKE